MKGITTYINERLNPKEETPFVFSIGKKPIVLESETETITVFKHNGILYDINEGVMSECGYTEQQLFEMVKKGDFEQVINESQFEYVVGQCINYGNMECVIVSETEESLKLDIDGEHIIVEKNEI